MAVVVSGDDPRYRELLALFYADEGANLTDSGLAVLAAMVTGLPEDADVKAGFGWALIAAGDTERGEALIDEALTLEPDNQRALYYKARLLLARDAREDAIRLFSLVAAGESEFSVLASAVLRGPED
jgi:Flp pilus assembly protein TadD